MRKAISISLALLMFLISFCCLIFTLHLQTVIVLGGIISLLFAIFFGVLVVGLVREWR